MPKLLISLSKNKLKVSYINLKKENKATFRQVAYQIFELPDDVVMDTFVLDSAKFVQAVNDAITQIYSLVSAKAPKNVSLTFLVEPQDIILKFVTVNKRDGNPEDQILSEVTGKLGKVKIEDLYFTYSKVAPFVYQFIGIEKARLDQYLELANLLGADLKSVVPWALLLPKFTRNSEPSIYVSNQDNKHVVILSELRGVYYTSVFAEEKSTSELEKLVHELSIYKRSTPINKIYTLDAEEFSLDPSYEIVPIKFDGYEPVGASDLKGIETHLMIDSAVNSDPEMLLGPDNLLNLLPLPAVVKKPTSLVYVGSALTMLLLLGGIFGFVYLYKQHGNVPTNGEAPVVLSESDTTVPVEKPVEEVKPELKKEDIKIRVENGSGISGVAAKTQKFLQDKGYTVPEIGNADESDRETTLIKLTTAKAAYKDMLIADMKSDYELVVEDGLAENLGYDVLVVVGSK